MSLGTTYSPTVSVGGATSYKLWPGLKYSNGYWKVYRRFQEVFFLLGGGVRARASKLYPGDIQGFYRKCSHINSGVGLLSW